MGPGIVRDLFHQLVHERAVGILGILGAKLDRTAKARVDVSDRCLAVGTLGPDRRSASRLDQARP